MNTRTCSSNQHSSSVNTRTCSSNQQSSAVLMAASFYCSYRAATLGRELESGVRFKPATHRYVSLHSSNQHYSVLLN